jgi:SHS family lactate transporter-like MFS transporter
MLDAFDYFLVIFVLRRLASDFRSDVETVTWAITATLMMRPIGAFFFGRLAERYGRRPVLIGNVLAYSALELASAFAPSLGPFILLRALFGIAMGGVWGVGASLAFESIPVRSRGLVSGLLQAGYPCGYLLAAVVFGLAFPYIGWRGMFVIGAAPALLTLYISSRIPESSVWKSYRQQRSAPPDVAHADRSGGTRTLWAGLAGHWRLAIYAVILMTAFNFFAHGTQDLYPTFLGAQRHLSTGTISVVAVVYNIGAFCGGLFFGRLSGRIGRRRAIVLAAMLALPVLPFWVLSTSPLGLAVAAFLMQFMVQGAWGVVPVHLNELSPEGIRATFPGVVYQLGNLIASANATLQAGIAISRGSTARPDYAFSLAVTCAIVVVALVLLTLCGPERRDASFGELGSGR